MKELTLEPDEVLFSHFMNKYEGGSLRDLEEAVLNDTWDEVPPIYVITSEEVPDKYLVYNGNHRAYIAKLFDIPLKAVFIESPEDYEQIPTKEYAYWPNVSWQKRYETEPTADTEFGLVILKIVESTLHTLGLDQKRPTEITWESEDKEGLELILENIKQ